MAGELSREQRRNLAKAIGTTAVDAMDQARQLAYQTKLRTDQVANEVYSQGKTLAEATARLDGRADGLRLWCDKNEGRTEEVWLEVGSLKGRLDATDVQVRILQSQRRLDVREHGRLCDEFTNLRHASLLERLWWLLTGRLPAVPELAGTVAEGTTVSTYEGVSRTATFNLVAGGLDVPHDLADQFEDGATLR